MIFDQDLVTCNDFSDCNDEVIVIGVDFLLAEDQFVASTLRVVLLGSPNKDSYSRSLNPSPMVAERKSRNEGDESVSYTVSDDATIDILSLIQMRFALVLERQILQPVQCFGVDRWIWLRYGFDVRQGSVRLERQLHREKP